MKNYNLIVTVLFKSGVEKVYKAQSKEKIYKSDMVEEVKYIQERIKTSYESEENIWYEIDNTIINIQDTSAITFSYEEINND